MSTKRQRLLNFPERHSEVDPIGLDPKVVRNIAEQATAVREGVRIYNRCRRR